LSFRRVEPLIQEGRTPDIRGKSPRNFSGYVTQAGLMTSEGSHQVTIGLHSSNSYPLSMLSIVGILIALQRAVFGTYICNWREGGGGDGHW